MKRVILNLWGQQRLVTIPNTVTLFQLKSIIWKLVPQMTFSDEIFVKNAETQALHQLLQNDIADLLTDGSVLYVKAELEEDYEFHWANTFSAKPMDDVDHFKLLPRDAIITIAKCLNMREAVRLGRTSKSFQFLLDDESIWEHFCGVELSQFCPLPGKSWKSTYSYLSFVRFDDSVISIEDEITPISFEEHNRIVMAVPGISGQNGRSKARSLRFFERGRHQIDITIVKTAFNRRSTVGLGFVNENYNFFSSSMLDAEVDYMIWDDGSHRTIENGHSWNSPLRNSTETSMEYGPGDIVTFDLNMDRKTLKYYVNGQFKAVWNEITPTRLWLVACLQEDAIFAITRHNSVEYPLSVQWVAAMMECKDQFELAKKMDEIEDNSDSDDFGGLF